MNADTGALARRFGVDNGSAPQEGETSQRTGADASVEGTNGATTGTLDTALGIEEESKESVRNGATLSIERRGSMPDSSPGSSTSLVRVQDAPEEKIAEIVKEDRVNLFVWCAPIVLPDILLKLPPCGCLPW